MLKYYFNLLFLNFRYLFRIKTQDMKNNKKKHYVYIMKNGLTFTKKVQLEM